MGADGGCIFLYRLWDVRISGYCRAHGSWFFGIYWRISHYVFIEVVSDNTVKVFVCGYG